MDLSQRTKVPAFVDEYQALLCIFVCTSIGMKPRVLRPAVTAEFGINSGLDSKREDKIWEDIMLRYWIPNRFDRTVFVTIWIFVGVSLSWGLDWARCKLYQYSIDRPAVTDAEEDGRRFDDSLKER